MKKRLLTLLLAAGLGLAVTAQAQIVLVGWDFEQGGGRERPDVYASGVDVVQEVEGVPLDATTASYLSNYTFDGNNGSGDETWGTSSIAPTPRIDDGINTGVSRSTKFRAGDGSSIQDITVKLLPGADYTLESMHFDYLMPFNASPRDLVVSYISGLDDAGPVELFSVTDSAKVITMTGVDIDLGIKLTDLNFVGGESVVFRFDFTDADNSGASFIDNIALVAVPEPATVALFAGLAVLGLVILSRRQRA